MISEWQSLLQHLIYKYLIFDIESIKFSSMVTSTLLVNQSLLNLSYMQSQQQFIYYDVVRYLVRPHLLIGIVDLNIFAIISIVIYVGYIFVRLPYRNIVSIFGQLLDVSLLNILMENQLGITKYIIRALLGLIYIGRQILVKGSLDIQISNFQTTRGSSIDKAIKAINLIQIILFINQIDSNTIVIISICNSILCIMYQTTFPHQSINLTTLLIGIQIMSIYYGITILTELYITQADIVIIPLLFKLTQIMINKLYVVRLNSPSIDYLIIRLIGGDDVLFQCNKLELFDKFQSQQQQSKMSVDNLIILSTIYMHFGKNYFAYNIINQLYHRKQFNNTTIINQSTIKLAKLQLLQQKCLNKIKLQITSSNCQHPGMQMAIQELIIAQSQTTQTLNQIIHLLKLKVYASKQIREKSLQFSTAIMINEQLIRTKLVLQQQFQSIPSKQNQAVLVFYYAEVLNDFLNAYNFQKSSSRNIFSEQTYVNQYFNNRMVSMVVDYGSELIISKISDKTAQLFSLDPAQLVNRSIDFLIPSGIVEKHDLLIQNMFISGYSKFIGKFDDNYYYCPKTCRLISIEFALQVLYTRDRLSFIIFFQPTNLQKMTIIVNQDQIITTVSNQLVINLQLNTPNILIGHPICTILPSFRQIVEEYNCLENVEFHLPQSRSVSSQQTYAETGQFRQYITTAQVHAKSIGELKKAYFIITFDYIRRNQLYQSALISPLKVNQLEDQLDEIIHINIPYEQSVVRIDHNQIDLDCLQNYNIISPQQSMLMDQQNQSRKQLYFTKHNSRKLSLLEIEEKELPPQPDIDRGGSQASQTVNGIAKSKYYNKYEMVNRINQLISYSKHHRLLNYIVNLNLLLQLVIAIIQFSQLNQGFIHLEKMVDLLQIENLGIQPLESFLVTRWTMVYYNTLYYGKLINVQQYLQFVEFPKSNLDQGYDLLMNNLGSVLKNTELSSFLEDTYLPVYLYINSTSGQQVNLSLRNSISLLLNYQYTFKMAFKYDGLAEPDSPYVYYSYKNYIILKNEFQTLNNQILQEVLDDVTIQMDLTYSIYVAMMVSFILLIIASTFLLLQIQRNTKLYASSLLYFDPIYLDHDISRYENILNILDSDSHFIFQYHFNLEEQENQLGKQEIVSNKSKWNKSNQQIHISLFRYILIYLVLILIIFLGTSSIYYISFTFFTAYPSIAQIYKQISDLGTDVATMYAQREVRYGRVYFPYLSDQDFENFLQEIKMALQRVSEFDSEVDGFIKLNQASIFYEYLNTVQNSNLCELLDSELKIKVKDICVLSFSGNLQRGLKGVLIDMVNTITTDMAINNFTIKTQFVNYELEGAFIVSEVIRQINQQFNSNFVIYIQDITYLIYALSIAYFVLIVVTLLLNCVFAKQWLVKEYSIAQKLIYLAPRMGMFLDYHYERYLRGRMTLDMVY